MKRALTIALSAVAVPAAVLLLAVGAFLWGVEVDGGFLRARLERVLTAAFDVPTRIEGRMRLQTGRAATISADALVLADPSGPRGATLARGIAPRARIDLLALLRGEALLEFVEGERLELTLRRSDDGRANWAQLFASSSGGSAAVSFAGIERLRIGVVDGSFQRAGGQPVPFSIRAFDGALPLSEPLTASGTAHFAGQEVGFTLRTASLVGISSSASGIPLQGTLQWSGARATIDGRTLDGGRRLEATVEASAADGAMPLAALGVAVHEPGPLDLRGKLALTATEATASELALTLGASQASGSAGIAWGGPRTSIAIDLAGERLDVAPWQVAARQPTELGQVEQWIGHLERLASSTDANVQLDIGEVVGLPVTVSRFRGSLHSCERTVAAKAAAVVAGTPLDASLDYDARAPQRTLVARIDSGAASTASLPSGARPAGLAASAGMLRGRFRANGADPAAITASLQGDLEARNLRWSHAGSGRPPVQGRFDHLRIALQATASSAEVSGKIEGAACAARISGGAAGPLLAGQPWPVQLSANCPNERVNAKGRIALAGRQATADLTFDVAADRSGPVARTAGLPALVPYPIAARGALELDARQTRLQLATFRIGRSNGSGEIGYPLDAAATPRLRLAMATLNLDELAAKAGPSDAAAEEAARRPPRAHRRLPDADIDLAADRIEYGDKRLRDFKLNGALRARRLQAAPWRIEWDGIALRGKIDLDFGGEQPRLAIDGVAQDADLRPLLIALGAGGARVRAGQLSVSATAQGERLRELLGSATIDGAVDRAQVELQRPLLPGATGRGLLDVTFSAAPGRPAKFTARGAMDGQPVELAADGPALDLLARDGAALPVALRSTIGDVRFEAEGRFARDGTGEARLRLAGGRLDQLGSLVGLALPEVAPYAASANVSLATGTLELSELEASFGNSRVSGRARIEQREGGRALHTATLRAPVLHLEDIGAGRWLGERAQTGPAQTEEAARQAQAAIEQLLELLPRADVEASVDIDALAGGGQHFASGRLLASLNAGALHARMIDVQAQDGVTNVELRIDAGASPPRLRLRADARDVEYGALARAMHPASQLDGTLDVVADLSAQSPPDGLLRALQGTVDFAVYPRGMNADALGVWGAGLLPAILRAVERDSQAEVQCSVAGFAVADGVARSDGFFVETTRVRIIGDLELRLGSWELSGRIDPRSNTPQFFAIAPRMQIGGAVGSPTLSVAAESVVLAPLRFASPLALFSRDWLGRGDRRLAGKAGCRDAFERVLDVHHGQAGGG